MNTSQQTHIRSGWSSRLFNVVLIVSLLLEFVAPSGSAAASSYNRAGQMSPQAQAQAQAQTLPPDLTEDHVSVTVPEGQTATNSGTFWNVNGHPLTLSASVGALTAVPIPTHFFKGDGNANDSGTPGGTVGTINGSVTFTTGQVSQAFSFPGSGGSAASTPNVSYPAADFAPGTGDFSVVFGIQTTSALAAEEVLSNRDSVGASNFFEVRLNSNGTLLVTMYEDAAATNHNELYTTGAINDGLFHHIAATRVGTTVKVYIDGSLNISGTTAAPTNITGDLPFQLGAAQEPFASYIAAFTGLLDEVRIYNQALSAADIARDYSTFMTGQPALTTALNVVGYWKLGEDDPGATAGGTGTNPTLGRDGNGLNPALDLTRHGTPTYTAVGTPASVIFNSFSGAGAFAGPTVPNVVTTSQPWVITKIFNWHQNSSFSSGQNPTTVSGTISILDYPSGSVRGTWPAIGASSNLAWQVFPNLTLPAGSYQIIESQTGPSSWSYTTTCSGCGGQWQANKGLSQVSAAPAPDNGSTLAMTFNGSASYVLGSPATTATDNFGIDVWLMPTANLTTTQRMIINGAVPNNGFGIDLVNMVISGRYNTTGTGPGSITFSSGVTATVGAWYHVILVRDSGVTRMYVNDALVYQNSSLSAPLPATNFGIGSGAGFTVFFTGAVDEARVFTFTPGTWTCSYTPDDGPAQSQSVTITATDTISGEVTTLSFPLTVVNVAPTATFANGGAVNEGSTGTVSFSGQSDPSTADTTAGFHYAYDFDNDSTFEVGDGTYAGSSTTVSATVPASYLADGPGTRTVLGRILDKDGGFTDYTTTITINNVAPVAQDQSVTTTQGTPVTITLVATDAGNDPLTYSIVTPPAHGTLSGTGADRIYTPTVGWSGSDSFTFTANDSVADSNVATVSITVSLDLTEDRVSVMVNEGQTATNTGTYAHKGPAPFALSVSVGTLYAPRTLFADNFDGEPLAAFTTTLSNWNVTRNNVAVLGPGSFNPAPGNGNYLRMFGTGSGKIQSKTAFNLAPGTYELSFKIAYVAGDPVYCLRVTVGSFVNSNYCPPGTTFNQSKRQFTVSSATSVSIVFDENSPSSGTLLDDVKLVWLNPLSAQPNTSLNVQGYWQLGEDDPGAANGLTGNNPTLGRDANGLTSTLDLTRDGSPTYTMVDGSHGSVRAMSFNGSDAYTRTNPVTTVTDNFGIEARVRHNDADDEMLFQPIMHNGNGTTNGFGLAIAAGGTDMHYYGVYGGLGAAGQFDTGIVATVNEWHDVALVRDNGITRMYVDGTLVYSNTAPAPLTPTGAFAIGKDPFSPWGWALTGSVDDARVFTFAPGTFDPQDLLINTSVSGNWSWSYTPNDGPAQSQNVMVTATTGVSGDASSLPFSLVVNNVAPTAGWGVDDAFLGDPVTEGSASTVTFYGQHDPSIADTTAGFHYAYDFNNDGVFDLGDGTYAGSGTADSATVPASFLADGPGTRTVLGRIIDKDDGFTDYTTDITINNVAPVAQDQSVTTTQNTPVTITLVVTDAGNDPLTYSIVTPPVHGTLSGTDANRIYTPTVGWSGSDSFTFWANDGAADSNIATVNITVMINTFSLRYAAGANGSLTGAVSQTVNYGGDGTAVTAVPNTGYHFVN